MTVPYSFGTATSAIPLSQLDSNFNTPITLGNTAIQLGNTVTTLNNMTLANVTISSGNVTLTNVSVTTANVATANIATSIITSSETLSYGTANGVAYLNGSKVVTTGSALVFDGTNLGIGTSSPSALLTISSGSGTKAVWATTRNFTVNRNWQIAVDEYAEGLFTITPSTTLGGTTFTTPAIRLDTSGNLGLGVTPSASATFPAFEIGAGNCILGSGNAFVDYTYNAYYSSTGYKYKATGAASYFEQGAGAFRWFTAPSGTAGNAITFTQAMTLDASGNLLVGNTSGFSVGETNTVQAKGPFVLAANNTGSASNRNWLMIVNSSGAGNLDFVDSATNTGWPNNAYRMTLTSSGNLGLGVTPSAWNSNFRALQTGSGYASFVGDGSNGYAEVLNNCYASGASTYTYFASLAATRYSQQLGVHKWYTAGSGTAGNAITFTQAMTLDASGNLGLDVTNPGARLDVYSPSTTAATPIAYFGKALNSTATSNILVSFLINSGGTGSGNIVANGANQAAFATSSDARIKENISNIEPQLDKIMALRPVEFDYIESEGGGHQIGFIAQEMEDVYADSVGEREDGMKMISGWSRTEARLVKALQEMKAIIDEQAARIAALEAK